MLTRHFAIENEAAAGMDCYPSVDWSSVISQAIRFKLKMLRQTSSDGRGAAPSRKPRRPRGAFARKPDPSPAEIMRRAAEVRAMREERPVSVPMKG